MIQLDALEERTPVPLLIVFGDLTRYTVRARRTDDAELAEMMDAYYERVGHAVIAAGGRLVKFIGDAFLAVFPESYVDQATEALLTLKQDVDADFEGMRWDSRLILKGHFGTVIAGPYGTADEKRFDVIGSEVNTAALVASRGFAYTAEAFRKLAPETRKRLKKHTPPITYIRREDRHWSARE